MIKVENLTKIFQSNVAVDRVSFEIGQGEIVGFLGPNGAGKTTTMRMITGALPATAGRAQIAGFDVFEDPIEVKRRIGYLPETPPVHMEMIIRDYLEFVARIKGVPPPKIRSEVDRVMERAQIHDVQKRLIGNMSKGYRQRVGLAQALLNNPQVLILDEPTVGLDPSQIHEVRTLIQDLRKEHTIILSTHILPEVEMTCQRVIMIAGGKVIRQDTIENIMRSHEGEARVEVTVARPSDDFALKLGAWSHGCRVAPGNRKGTFVLEGKMDGEARENIAKGVVDGGFGLLEMRDVSARLEEVFIKLVREEKQERVQERN